MQAVPTSSGIGPKKGRTELERTKEKLLGISQKHNDVVINNVSHRQKIRELEDELFDLRDECQGLRERNIALLARVQRQSIASASGGSTQESQVLLHLVNTLLNATPALAQLRAQLEQATAADANASMALLAPAPFAHWTPKLNPPGNVKASAEPIGIDGVLEEADEDAEQDRSQSHDIAPSASSSSLSSVASSSSSRSLHQQLDDTVVSRSQSRSSRAARRSSGLVPPPILPGQQQTLALPRSSTLDSLPDMEDEWDDDGAAASPPPTPFRTEHEQLIQHVPEFTPDLQVTSPPLSSISDMTPTIAKPIPLPPKSATAARPPQASRPIAAPAPTAPSSSTARKSPAPSSSSSTASGSAQPPARKPPPPFISSSSSTSAPRATKPLPPSSASETSSSSSRASSSTASASSAPLRGLPRNFAAPVSASKPRSIAADRPSSSSAKLKSTGSAAAGTSTSTPLSSSTAANVGLPLAAGPPTTTKGSLPGVKMRDVAEAMRAAAAKASTPPPSTSQSNASDPSTPLRALSLESPVSQPSATVASTQDEDSQDADNGRRLGRARKSVNYKEPSLNTKMRNPVATMPKKTKRASSAAGAKNASVPSEEDELSHSLLTSRDSSNPALVVPTSGIVRRKSVLLKRGAPPPASSQAGTADAAVEYELTSDDDDSQGESASERDEDDDQQMTPRAMKVVTPAPRSSTAVERRRESGTAPPAAASRRASHRFSVGVGG